MSDTPINNGGPAFPRKNPRYDGNWDKQPMIEGMTLRDWFATYAPEKVPEWFFAKEWRKQEVVPAPEIKPDYVKLEWVTYHEPTIEHLTRWKYHYADAMLAERAKEAKK